MSDIETKNIGHIVIYIVCQWEEDQMLGLIVNQCS